MHRFLGYITLCALKTNIYVRSKNVWLWFGIDVGCIVLYIVVHLIFPKMEAKTIAPKYNDIKQKVKSVKELDQNKSYVVFANNIYDIQPLRYNHPAGYQIVEVLKNKEVDRYIYGSCVAD